MYEVERLAEEEEEKVVARNEESIRDVLHQALAIEIGPLVDVFCS